MFCTKLLLCFNIYSSFEGSDGWALAHLISVTISTKGKQDRLWPRKEASLDDQIKMTK